MRHAVKTQMFWEETKHTLRDYLMTTSIPIIFEKLLEEPDIFENKNWENFMRPNPAPNRPAPITYERTSLHDFVWEFIFKDRLFAVFYDRLLGSQTEPERYVQRSESYAALFNDMIGGSNCSNDLYSIIERFFGMVKDYLCRNLPGHESDYTCLTTQKVLSAFFYSGITFLLIVFLIISITLTFAMLPAMVILVIPSTPSEGMFTS